MPDCLTSHDDHLLLRVKAVPGASRDGLAGPLGDRLKIRIAAPPEGGQANIAIVKLLARTLGLNRTQVEISSGHGSPEKTIRLEGIDLASALSALGL
ncbi:MAG: DUF167 domain-containing protein [Planctomycetota bacterium]|nr:DUF167 domain-containing protein [Planctomycetota bacterium]